MPHLSMLPTCARLTLPLLLLLCAAVSARPAAAQICEPWELTCGPGGGGGIPPEVTISPSTGTYSGGSVAVEIGWSGSGQMLDPATVQILVNGLDVTSQFSHSFAAGTEGTSAGEVTLAWSTTLELAATVCVQNGPCTTGTVTYTGAAAPIPPATVEVAPKDSAVVRAPARNFVEVFVVRNTGTAEGAFTLLGVCGGPLVLECRASRASAVLGSGDSTRVAVTYSTADDAIVGTNRVMLKAWNSTTTAVRDSGSYIVGIGGDLLLGPPDATGPGEVGENTRLDRGDCVIAAASGAAYECGDLRLAHALPATRVLNRSRAPTLIYNSQHARPHPVVAIPFTPTASGAWPAPTVTEIQAAMTIGGVVVAQRTWSGLQISTMPGWNGELPTYRLALGFDFDTEDPTDVYDYQVELTVVHSDGTVENRAPQDGQLVVVNRTGSPFGAGWWVAGVESLRFPAADTASRLWVGGDGSHRIYRRVNPTTWAADPWDRPDTLRLDTATGLYVRMLPGRVEVRFDTTGLHVRTVNAAGHWTRFDWDDRKLTRIHLPRSASFDSGYSYLFEYANAGGRLSRVVPPGLPRPVEIGMDAGRITSISGPDAHGVGFTYSGTSRVPTSRVDRRQVATTFAFDAGMRLARISNTMTTPDTADDIIVRFRAAESQGIVAPFIASDVYTRIDGPRADVVDHTKLWLNGAGALVRMEDAIGNTRHLVRADSRWPALVTETVAPNGLRSTAVYDSLGNVASQTQWNPFDDGRNATTLYRYDTACPYFASEVTAPMGEVTRIGYDGAPSCNRIWQEDGRGAASRTEFRYYTAGPHAGLPRAVDGPMTWPDSLSYDALGNLQVVENASGARTEFENDLSGRTHTTLTQVDTASVLRQQTWYDVMDRDTLSVTYGDASEGNAEVKKEFDAGGNVRSVARRSSNDINGIGWITTRWRYDAAGRSVAEIPADSIWGGGAPYAIKDSTRYDAAGNVVEVITRRGHSISMQYDALNRLTHRFVPEVRYPWVVEGNGWAFPYYSNQSDSSFSIPADVETFVYDDGTTKTGQLAGAANRDAVVRRSYYPGGALRGDTLKISTWVTLDQTQHVYGLEFEYDLNGRRSSMLHPDLIAPRLYGTTTALRSQTWAYDAYTGQLASITNPMGSTFAYVYDLEGRVETFGSPGGVQEAFSFDSIGRLARRIHTAPNVTSGPQLLHDDVYEYDLRGKARHVYRPGPGSQQRDTMSYSLLGALRFMDSRLDAQHSDHEGFTADALGNAYETGTGGINQPWKITRHLYEPGTGRLYRSESVDPSQAYMYFDSIHAYDESGNQHRRGGTRGTGGSVNHISISHSYYGADQRLRAVDRRVCSINQYFACRPPSETLFINDPGVFEEYRYDPLGRRIAVRTRREHQCLGDGCRGAVLRTVWDGDQVLYEIRAPGWQGATAAQMENDTTTLRGTLAAPYGRILYTHGLGIDQPLSMVRMGYTWGDGSRAAAEPLTGAHEIVLYANWRGTYDRGGMPDGSGRMPFGTDAQGTVSMVAAWPGRNLGAFLGQRRDVNWQSWMGGQVDQQRDASGLLYRRNRYYDPASGRFTQEDPIGLAGGLNVYGYANADPISYSDPYGLCKKDKDGNEDPDCRRVIDALNAAAAAAKVRRGQRNLFGDAARAYEATNRDVVFVGARDRRLNEGGQNNDGDPGTFAMGRTMPPVMWGIPKMLGFGGEGDILIGNFLGVGDMVMTAAHEMLAHGEQGIPTDSSRRIDDLNDDLWEQLPAYFRPSAELWRRKLR